MILNKLYQFAPAFFLILQLNAQSYPPPTNLISVPSAATLQRGSYSLQMHVQKDGGLTSSISVGLTDRFQLGLSYGSANLIGDDSLVMHPKPEANLKYLLIDETESIPGISIGLRRLVTLDCTLVHTTILLK